MSAGAAERPECFAQDEWLEAAVTGALNALIWAGADEEPLEDADGIDPSVRETLREELLAFASVAREPLEALILDRECFDAYAGAQLWSGANPVIEFYARLGHDYALQSRGYGVGFCDRPELGPYGELLSEACPRVERFPIVGDSGEIFLE